MNIGTYFKASGKHGCLDNDISISYFPRSFEYIRAWKLIGQFISGAFLHSEDFNINCYGGRIQRDHPQFLKLLLGSSSSTRVAFKDMLT